MAHYVFIMWLVTLLFLPKGHHSWIQGTPIQRSCLGLGPVALGPGLVWALALTRACFTFGTDSALPVHISTAFTIPIPIYPYCIPIVIRNIPISPDVGPWGPWLEDEGPRTHGLLA